VAIVLVEQNARAALALADRAYILVQGRNRHEGPAQALRSNPMIAALYFGGFEAEGAP
jgi:branched-chain amino acid transport system ATP-binding protein